MTSTTGDVLTRTSGRFVRNLALSLSGGALVTLLGASAAQADDLSDAGTTSDGAGAAHSGDAEAVGNRSGSNTNQGASASGALGGLQVTNQNAAIGNAGLAVANTGGNTATGNRSVNTASGTQDALNLLGPAVNSGSAHNGSTGSAFVSTGNASAVGNQSTTNLTQDATSAQGTLGGIIIIGQNAAVLNSGVALADSGQNNATGNSSTNDSILDQLAQANAGLAANNGKARNDSDGKATISTGNAAAIGNESDTKLMQSGAGSTGGDVGGLVIIEQGALVANVGLAQATTGDNFAIGNDSVNTDDGFGLPEGAGIFQRNPDGGIPIVTGVVSNTAEASNASDGTAGINTGNATAAGNRSSSAVDQTATGDVTGPGALTSQLTSVLNAGFGNASSGGNSAIGNRSDNDAAISQAHNGELPLFGVSAFQASASNSSDGDATVDTGDAWALGNGSASHVSQEAVAKGDVFNVLPQVSGVQNVGLATATTGDNDATGNWSGSATTANQDLATLAGTQIGPVVLSNTASVANSSDGTASITTGDARATGNTSSTDLDQVIDPTGLVLPSQVADVVNLGVADANTGGNFDIGNNSFNPLNGSQYVDLGTGEEPVTMYGALIGSNSADLSVTTDGSADITTGDATASGNESATSVVAGL